MAGEIRKISINEIVNYYENPRHAVAMNEKDTLKKLFEAVGNQYMLNLAEDIERNGLLGNQQLVVVYKDELKKFVVYEGNRRIAAIKLLSDLSLFDFLDKATYDKAEKIGKRMSTPIQDVLCYVTDEKEAFFIMERLHSGEDKGRGVKAWSSREKDVFKVRRNDKKTLAYLIDHYVRKYCDNLDITSIMPFTTIQRIFGNKKVKAAIGLNINDENTFNESRMELVVNVSRNIAESAKQEGCSVTRLYNLASEIEEKVIPIIDVNNSDNISVSQENLKKAEDKIQNEKINNVNIESTDANIFDEPPKEETSENSSSVDDGKLNVIQPACAGSKKNLPYFFLGIDYSHLNPSDADTHGIAEICRELRLFSEKQLVDKLPIAAGFLTRSAIEQALIYYSKKHCIQGQNKLIWENIKNLTKLSKIIENYNKNLPNYIKDAEIRQYFRALFSDYEKNVDPLNWVVHRPAEFQFETKTLVELPKRGLLTLINFLIAE